MAIDHARLVPIAGLFGGGGVACFWLSFLRGGPGIDVASVIPLLRARIGLAREVTESSWGRQQVIAPHRLLDWRSFSKVAESTRRLSEQYRTPSNAVSARNPSTKLI